MDVECVCDPAFVNGFPYSQFVGTYFSDCIYTTADHVSFGLGLINICCWMVAQLPQLYLNYTLGKAEALSRGLLVTWLLGDFTNLIGCYLTGQLPTQKFTALYYVCIDTVTLAQYLYYHSDYHNRHPHAALCSNCDDQQSLPLQHDEVTVYNSLDNGDVSDDDDDMHARDALLDECKESVSPLTMHTTTHTHDPSHSPSLSSVLSLSVVCVLCVMVSTHHHVFTASASHTATPVYVDSALSATISSAPLCVSPHHLPLIWQVVGALIAWCSGILYFCSRIPQILTNYERHNQGLRNEGLSFTMFGITFFANFIYGVSVILRVDHVDLAWVINTFPFLLGSMGTMVFDCIILIQGVMYTHNKQ